jgi:hypothetical protein
MKVFVDVLVRDEKKKQIKSFGGQVLGGPFVRMPNCCLQGIQPCGCKGEGHRLDW